MNDYRYFSLLYDELTEDMDYNPWINIVKEFEGNVLDVGCGSGSLLIYLNNLGYNCMGLDLSNSMLELARKKFIMNHLNIPLINDNMITFKLENKFDIITSFFDTFNHLTNENDVLNSLINMSNHLTDNGVMIIDLFTKEKMEDINNEEFEFDEFTYYAKWLMNSTDTNIIHNLEFKVGDEVINEEYVETYYDIKKILPNTLTIKQEIPIVIDGVCERIVYIIKKL